MGSLITGILLAALITESGNTPTTGESSVAPTPQGWVSAPRALVAQPKPGAESVPAPRPAPTPAPGYVPPTTDAPPPPAPAKEDAPALLAPGMSSAEEARLTEEAHVKIAAAEHAVRQIDTGKLTGERQERFLTIESFLVKARVALSQKDFDETFKLADKARILAEELSAALE